MADIGYLMYFPLLMMGLLSYPQAVRSRSDRAKMWLDVAIVVCSCTVAIWHFAVAPELLAGRSDLAVFLVTVGQPIGDVVTLLGITVLWLRRSGGARNSAITLLAIAVLTSVISDVLYASLVRSDSYESGGLIDIGWLFSYFLIALAAFRQRSNPGETKDESAYASRSMVGLAIPYVAVALVYGLLINLAYSTSELSMKVIVTGTSIITLLVIIRQMAAVRENIRLTAAAEADKGVRRLEALVQNSVDVISILDVDTVVRYVSPAIERLAGFTPEGATGLRIVDIVHRDDRSAAILFFAELARDGAVNVRGEWRMRNATNQWRLTENVGVNLTGDPMVAGLVVNTRDITESRSLELQLRHQAFHDSLTGVANRQLFTDRVQHAFKRAARDRSKIAVLFIDLDNFKGINDTQGHAVGDQVLVAVANRLSSCIRDGDTLARLGGDEFAILLEDLADPADALRTAERMSDALRAPVVLEGLSIIAVASVGISGGLEGETPDALLRNADVAMYVAKSDGKGKHVQFRPDMHSKVLERLEMEADLRRALDENQFVLNYQPIVGLKCGELASVEALIRWNHPERGLLMPGSFIMIAEESGLIVLIGRWALREATRQAREWELASGRGVRVGVNISTRHLCEPSLIDDVRNALNESGLDPRHLLLEITESVLMTSPAEIIPVLNSIKGMGISIALDDFGTGYSSLSYLQQLPIDVLKIDKSFMDMLVGENADPVLVKAIVSLGSTLRLRVVAEGIESSDQLSHLKDLGCDFGQGFYFDRAVSAERIQAYLSGDKELSTINIASPEALSAA